jgi:hypothetical protein
MNGPVTTDETVRSSLCAMAVEVSELVGGRSRNREQEEEKMYSHVCCTHAGARTPTLRMTQS